jgi:hypothetical protein
MTLPGHKQFFRMTNADGHWVGADVIVLTGESVPTEMHHAYEPFKSMDLSQLSATAMHQQVMKNGQKIITHKTTNEIAEHVQQQMALLPADYHRFDNPHRYKVGISPALKQQRDKLITQLRS